MKYLNLPRTNFYVQVLPWSCGYALLRKALEIYELEYIHELENYSTNGVSTDNILNCLKEHGVLHRKATREGTVARHLENGDVAILDSKPAKNEHVSLLVGYDEERDLFKIANHIPLQPWRIWFTWDEIQAHISRCKYPDDTIYLLRKR